MTPIKRLASGKTADCLRLVFKASGKRHLLLTGSKGIGKTTAVDALLQGENPPGIRSYLADNTVFLENRLTGEHAQIGHWTEKGMQPISDGFQNVGRRAIEQARAHESEWAVVDEIGFLERNETDYLTALDRLFDEKRVLAVLRKQEQRYAFQERADVCIIDLDTLSVGCVVMASGEGKRFGGNKLLTCLDGKPLLLHTLEHLPQELLAGTAVVTRSREVTALCGETRCILHDFPCKSDTIRLGIEQMQDMGGCMFCVADQPFCTEQSMTRLVTTFLQHPHHIVRLCFGEIPGNPVIFPQALFEELASLNGEQGGGAVIKRHEALLLSVQAEDARELMDIDTREDLGKLQ